MDYHEYKAQCVKDFVAAILSTGGPVTETILEAATYRISVHYAFKIADHIIEKLKAEDQELTNIQTQP
jgi:hypothetical protein